MSKIICPCCGAENTQYGTCEYCGGTIPRPIPKPDNTPKELGITDFIVPYEHREEDVKEALIRYLIETDNTPLDIFDNLEIKSITKRFIKMYYYEGTYEAHWNCTQIVQVERSRKVYDANGNARTEKYYEEEYYPANGTAVGSYGILSGDIPDTKTKLFGYPNNAKPYSESLLVDDAEIELDIDEIASGNLAERKIAESASLAAKLQAPSLNKDFFSSYTSRSNGYPRTFLMAFWYVKFSYKGKVYETAVRDGFWDFNAPIDENLTSQKDELTAEKLKEYNDDKSLAYYAFTVLGIVVSFLIIHLLDDRMPSKMMIYGGISVGILILGYVWDCFSEGRYNKKVSRYNESIDSYNYDRCSEEKRERAYRANRNYGTDITEYKDIEIQGDDIKNPPTSIKGYLKVRRILFIIAALVFLWGTFAFKIVEKGNRKNAQLEQVEQTERNIIGYWYDDGRFLHITESQIIQIGFGGAENTYNYHLTRKQNYGEELSAAISVERTSYGGSTYGSPQKVEINGNELRLEGGSGFSGGTFQRITKEEFDSRRVNQTSSANVQNQSRQEPQRPVQQTMVSDTQVEEANPNYFYVVIGSFPTLGEAKNFVNNASDVTLGNVYSTVSEGRTLYRVCSACYFTKEEAKRKVEAEKSYFRSRGDSDRQPWVWASSNRERCVYRPITEDDRYLPNFCDLN